MDKPHDMDDITLLSSRFHTLMDKVQGLIDELCPGPLPEIAGKLPPGKGQKAYTVRASKIHDERRHKALIKVIDDALSQIESVASMDMESSSPEPNRHASFRYGKKLFTAEELHFLEKTLRTFQPALIDGVHSDS